MSSAAAARYAGLFPVVPTTFTESGALDLESQKRCVDFIVTTTHFSTQVCAERSRRAQEMGAAMLMVMLPYHGATFRVGEPLRTASAARSPPRRS